MVTYFGYAAFVLICGFSWFQLGFSFRHRTINLGSWPMVVLVLGLALLQSTFFFVTVPLFMVIGNAASLTGSALNLLRVRFFREDKTLSKLQAAKLPLINPVQFPIPTFQVGEKKMPEESVNMASAIGPEYDGLRRSDFRECKECGSLVWSDPFHGVEIRVQDVSLMVRLEGHLGDIPLEHTMYRSRFDAYCKGCHPPYDREDIYPAWESGGETTLAFFQRVPSTTPGSIDSKYTDDLVRGLQPLVSWREVTSDGEPLD